MNNYPMHQQYQGSYHPMDGDIKSQGQQYMNYHVIAQGNDGSQFDGIIESMDDHGVTMLVAEEFDAHQARQGNEEDDTRQFNFGYDGYGRPRPRRHRRYHRRSFPFNFFVGFQPYPFFPYSPWY